MIRRVQLFIGEKDGARFDAPFPPGPCPQYLYATTDHGDQVLAEYKDTVEPPGLRDGLSMLAYVYRRQVKRKDRTGEATGVFGTPFLEYHYDRCVAKDRQPKTPAEPGTADGNC